MPEMLPDFNAAARRLKSRFTAAGWAILGGGFGCHWFYLKKAAWALPYIFLTCLGFWLFAKACASLSPSDAINMLTTEKIPDSITRSPAYIASLWLMGLPSLAGVAEGIVYLFTPKAKFDERYN